MYPSYLEASQNKKLKKITEKTFKLLESCCLCPRRCRVNRIKNELGYCATGLKAQVFSFLAHHGEEPPISGNFGSGTIFFSHCNMRCVYCQNYEFSQQAKGQEVEPQELANFMLQLQKMRCHNINLVTPTHILPQILEALNLAVAQGLNIPLVYNTSGYELPEIIQLLDGIVDIYLPDMRYAETAMAKKYSDAPDYPKHNQLAVKEMQRQVGVANLDAQGIIKRGLIIRHLVLPQGISGTKKIMPFIAKEISPDTYISLMSQYLPSHQAQWFPELSRRITQSEYAAAIKIMQECGLQHGWTQESHGKKRFAGKNIKPLSKKE